MCKNRSKVKPVYKECSWELENIPFMSSALYIEVKMICTIH